MCNNDNVRKNNHPFEPILDTFDTRPCNSHNKKSAAKSAACYHFRAPYVMNFVFIFLYIDVVTHFILGSGVGEIVCFVIEAPKRRKTYANAVKNFHCGQLQAD